MEWFQVEPGLRYRIQDPILRQAGPFHQESKFFATTCARSTAVAPGIVLYEARSRFAWEIVSRQEGVLWEQSGGVTSDIPGGSELSPVGTRVAYAGMVDESVWLCRPDHRLNAAQCQPCSSFVPSDVLWQIERDARRLGGGGAPDWRESRVALEDGRDYVDPIHQHWRACRLKNSLWRRALWVLYETTVPGTVHEVLRDGYLRVWQADGIGGEDGLGRYTPDERRHRAQTLQGLGLRPEAQSPGLESLRRAICHRKA